MLKQVTRQLQKGKTLGAVLEMHGHFCLHDTVLVLSGLNLTVSPNQNVIRNRAVSASQRMVYHHLNRFFKA